VTIIKCLIFSQPILGSSKYSNGAQQFGHEALGITKHFTFDLILVIFTETNFDVINYCTMIYELQWLFVFYYSTPNSFSTLIPFLFLGFSATDFL